MDAQDHAVIVGLHKAELDKQNEDSLKEDMCIHEANMKNALKKKEQTIAGKQDTLLTSDITDYMENANMKKVEKHEKEEAVKGDVHMHEERMNRAVHHQQELAAKQHADAERQDRNIKEHRKKAALRHAAAIPE